LAREAAADLASQLNSAAPPRRTVRLHLKYDGTMMTLPVAKAAPAEMRAAFEAAHRARFGFISSEKDVIAETLEVELAMPAGETGETVHALTDEPLPPPLQMTLLLGGAGMTRRCTGASVALIVSPAIIIEPHQTVVVGRFVATTLRASAADAPAASHAHATGTAVDPPLSVPEPFMAVPTHGRRSPHGSRSIRERLDFPAPCSAPYAHANAAHSGIWSMDASVQTVMRDTAGRMQPGDVYMLNAPYEGGTHLPDITVVTPIFGEAGGQVLFFVAGRGHHADIGGIAPGSLSPNARTVEEEGVYIDI
jgi:5-oxoprolinase (ATP-hydrolysing)